MQHDPEKLWREADAPRRLSPKFAQNPGYVSPKLRTIDPINWQDKPIPARRWVVEDWIPHGQTTMLAGDGGTGKSLLGMQLATCLAVDREWLGQRIAPCKVLYVAAEDDPDELARRQDSINRSMGLNFGDLGDLKWISRIGMDNNLMTWDRYGEEPGKPTELFDQIHWEAEEHGAGLVIFDSLHDFFAGNENSRIHARQFVQLLTSLARDREGACLILAHPSMAGRNTGTGEAGSTAWANSVRSRLYLTRPKDDEEDRDNGRVLRRMKANYAGIGTEIALTWNDGVFDVTQQLGGMIASIDDRRVEGLFLDCLDAITRQGRSVSDAPQSPRYMGKVFPKMPEARGAKKRQLDKAMASLFASGHIVIGTAMGADRHPQKAIVRTAGSAGSGVPSD